MQMADHRLVIANHPQLAMLHNRTRDVSPATDTFAFTAVRTVTYTIDLSWEYVKNCCEGSNNNPPDGLACNTAKHFNYFELCIQNYIEIAWMTISKFRNSLNFADLSALSRCTGRWLCTQIGRLA
jgi:hypothetical protein